MSRWWRWFLPGYVLLLPMTIVGLAICAIVYRASGWRWSRGCIECIGGDRIWGRPGAQTLGLVIVYADEHQRSRADLRVHERVHVVQGMVGGPLFAIVYALCFLVPFALQGFKDWHRAYHRNPFEKHAYRVGDTSKGWGE